MTCVVIIKDIQRAVLNCMFALKYVAFFSFVQTFKYITQFGAKVNKSIHNYVYVIEENQ